MLLLMVQLQDCIALPEIVALPLLHGWCPRYNLTMEAVSVRPAIRSILCTWSSLSAKSALAYYNVKQAAG